VKFDWYSTFPGYWAAQHLRTWAGERLAEVNKSQIDEAREALVSESWRIGLEATGVPDEVIEAYDTCMRVARIALRQDPPDIGKAMSALREANALVTP
jgi:hypothetical protein